ncbi:nitrous oxide reductase accessory protein NosL [Paucibacter sp. AS339]|uniref:nitrous oxide reductase accessory protein NosL n=1 Tax=Paucibacter hankyongi TaxID=3133434 RepID=UPI0030AF05E4
MLPVSAPLHGPLGVLSRLAWGAFAALALAGSLQWLPGQARLAGLDPSAEVCVVAPPTPYEPASGLALLAPRPVPADARCPVCGMYPARSRDWAAQVIFDNGDTQFFDSPLTLMLYLQDVGRYSRGRSAEQIAARYVTDANSGAWLAAEAAVYVHGSNASGPMRAGNLPAFGDAAAAQRFAEQRGGRLLTLAQIDAGLLKGLGAQGKHRH